MTSICVWYSNADSLETVLRLAHITKSKELLLIKCRILRSIKTSSDKMTAWAIELLPTIFQTPKYIHSTFMNLVCRATV